MLCTWIGNLEQVVDMRVNMIYNHEGCKQSAQSLPTHELLKENPKSVGVV